MAQRAAASPVGSVNPVSGATAGPFGFGFVVVVAAGAGASALCLPPPHPASATTTASASAPKTLFIGECIHATLESHLLEGVDAVVDRRMRVEEVVPLGVAAVRLLVERLLDPQVCGGLRREVGRRVVVLQFLERRDEAGWVAGEQHARGV